MKYENKYVKRNKFICFLLLISLFMALMFGTLQEEAKAETVSEMGSWCQVLSSDTKIAGVDFTASGISQEQENDIVDRILNSGTFLFGADLHMDQPVSSDSGNIDGNVVKFHESCYREMVTDMGLPAQAPISDTENATMQHTTYIINKNMKNYHHPGGNIWDNKGEHEISSRC